MTTENSRDKLEIINMMLNTLLQRVDRLQDTLEQYHTTTAPPKKKEMKITEFCEEYGWARDTVYDYIYNKSKHFPAHKVGGKWYIDVEKYKRWCKTEHINSYRYA